MKTILFLITLLVSIAVANIVIAAKHSTISSTVVSKRITKDTTLCVNNTGENDNSNCAKTFKSIQDALSYLNNYVILSNAVVTIKMTEAPGANYYNTIIVNHPNSDRFHIVGDCNNGSPCTINFNLGQNGIAVSNGNKLGLLSNFEFKGHSADSNVGVLVNNNSYAQVSDMVVKNFQYGVKAIRKAKVIGVNLNVTDNNFGIATLGSSHVTVKSGASEDAF
ncbi:MAG: hypothetical protein AAGB12_13160 [Pseudomonadota bacterium]